MLPDIPGSRSKVENPSGSAAGWSREGGGCRVGGRGASLPAPQGRGRGAGHPVGSGVGGPQATETTAGFNVPEKNSSSLESICSPFSEIQIQFQSLLLGSRPQLWWDSQAQASTHHTMGIGNVARPGRGQIALCGHGLSLWQFQRELRHPPSPPRQEGRDRGHRAPFCPLNSQEHPSPQSL